MNQNSNITIDITIRPQIAAFGVIDHLNDKNFSLDNGNSFFIKNEGNEPVKLEVIPAGSEDRKFIETTFVPGWNMELIQEIRQTPEVKNDLRFGY